MIYNPYPQYTRDWTNIRLNKPLTTEQHDWLHRHDGERYHVHNFQHAVKFERSEDAEWFVLRWL